MHSLDSDIPEPHEPVWRDVEFKYPTYIDNRLAQTQGVNLWWRKGRRGRWQRLTRADLAKGLWAIRCTGGCLTYREYDRYFKSCGRVGCHPGKAAAIYKALRKLGFVGITTPYDDWANHATEFRDKVREALGRDHGSTDLSWRKGRSGPVYRLTETDLAIALFAVDQNSGKGMSYGQLSRAFKTCKGVGCHPAKAAALFRALVALWLIELVSKYVTGKHGNVYTPMSGIPTPLKLPGLKVIGTTRTPIPL